MAKGKEMATIRFQNNTTVDVALLPHATLVNRLTAASLDNVLAGIPVKALELGKLEFKSLLMADPYVLPLASLRAKPWPTFADFVVIVPDSVIYTQAMYEKATQPKPVTVTAPTLPL